MPGRAEGGRRAAGGGRRGGGQVRPGGKCGRAGGKGRWKGRGEDARQISDRISASRHQREKGEMASFRTSFSPLVLYAAAWKLVLVGDGREGRRRRGEKGGREKILCFFWGGGGKGGGDVLDWSLEEGDIMF